LNAKAVNYPVRWKKTVDALGSVEKSATFKALAPAQQQSIKALANQNLQTAANFLNMGYNAIGLVDAYPGPSLTSRKITLSAGSKGQAPAAPAAAAPPPAVTTPALPATPLLSAIPAAGGRQNDGVAQIVSDSNLISQAAKAIAPFDPTLQDRLNKLAQGGQKLAQTVTQGNKQAIADQWFEYIKLMGGVAEVANYNKLNPADKALIKGLVNQSAQIAADASQFTYSGVGEIDAYAGR
jgi:hypothetical protein